jgi:hypothetical protein
MNPLLAVLLLAFIAINKAEATPSLLSLCHPQTNCKAVERLWNGQDTIVTGWLEKTFADDCQCADRLLASDKTKVVRIHLMNGPCMRNKRCGRYEPFFGYNKNSANHAVHNPNSRLMRRFTAVLDTTAKRLNGVKNLTCYVSPCLECDLNASARRVLLNHVSVALPHCNLVDNPHGQNCVKGYICERHGQNPKLSAPCIVDLDGKDGREIDVKKWVDRYKHCDLAYYWEPWMNCIRESFVDPRKRDCKYPLQIYKRTKELLCRYFSHLSFGTC